MVGQSRDNALNHVVVVVFENRSLDNVLGRLYGPGDDKTFEGVLGKDLSDPIPEWAEHGADRKTVPYNVATDMDSPSPDSGLPGCRTVPRSAARAHGSSGRGAEARSSLTNADSPDSRQGVIRQLGSGGSPRVSAAIHQRACQLVAKQRVSSCCHRTHRRDYRAHHPPLKLGVPADTLTVMGPDAPVIGVVRFDALNSESVVPLIVPPDTTAVVAPFRCSGRKSTWLLTMT